MSSFVFFVRCAQFDPPGAFMLPQTRGLWHVQGMLFLTPLKIFEAIDRMGVLLPLEDFEVEVTKEVTACVLARELK